MNEQQQRALTRGLKALAASTQNASSNPRVEAAVMAAFARACQPAQPAPLRANIAWGAIAATLIFACASGVWLSHRYTRDGEAAIQQAGFLQIPGTSFLPPMESGSIIRVALPVTALPSYGIQIVPDMTNESVEADLLIAQDGLARGIRLVNDSQTRSTP